MKKSLSFITAVTLASAMLSSFTASAEDFDESKPDKNTTDVEVYTEYSQTYTVTIPNNTVNPDSANAKISITASNVNLAEGARLDINLSSHNGFNLKNGGTDSIGYTITKDDSEKAIDTDTPVLTIIAENKTNSEKLSASETLKIKLNENASPKYAGKYSDTLTFTIGVTPPAEKPETETTTETTTTTTTETTTETTTTTTETTVN